MFIESKAAYGDVYHLPDGFVSDVKVVSRYTGLTSSSFSKSYVFYNDSFSYVSGRTYRISFLGQDDSEYSGNSSNGDCFLDSVSVSVSGKSYALSKYSSNTFDWVCDTLKPAFTFTVKYTYYSYTDSQVTVVPRYRLKNITIEDITPRTDREVLEDIEKVDKEQLEQQKEQTETQKGIFASIKEFFGSFFQNLIDSVIGLFVPSSDEMSDLFGQLNDFFSDTFGFLYAPFDYLIQLIGVFTSSSGTTGLTLPGFSIMGHEVWGDQTYDIASDPVAGKVLEYVRMGTGVLLAGWFIMYLQDFFKERFGKG